MRRTEASAKDVTSLFETKDYYHLANAAAARLCQPPPPPSDELLELFYFRVLSLLRLGLRESAARECHALGDIHSDFYRNEESGSCILPWHLRLLAIYLLEQEPAGYYLLARDVRRELKHANDPHLWQSRLAQIQDCIVSSLIRDRDWHGALNQIQTQKAHASDQIQRVKVNVELALLCLRIGHLGKAEKAIAESANGRTRSVLRILHLICASEFETAHDLLEHLEGLDDLRNSLMAITNLYTGRVPVARELLESLVSDPAGCRATNSDIFNLCTIYELCGDRSATMRKKELLEKARSRPIDHSLIAAEFKCEP